VSGRRTFGTARSPKRYSGSMEGGWRVATPIVAFALAVAGLAGCGTSDEEAVATDDPAATFAPLVLLDRADPFKPMSARWFLEHSMLRFAEDPPCADRTIAVGRTLGHLRTAATDWLYAKSLGAGPNYWRSPLDSRCDLDHAVEVDTHQLTRPFDSGKDRGEGLAPEEGFYLDLIDAARGGPERRGLGVVPVYADTEPATVDGEPGLELEYWMLFGMHAPPAATGSAHEGDWERFEVVVRTVREDEYVPVAVRLHGPDASRELPWTALEHVADAGSGAATHPVLVASRGDHTLSVARSSRCGRCAAWRTWRSTPDALLQPWYGFGGAWGEVGTDSATTGPLGPNVGGWPTERRSGGV